MKKNKVTVIAGFATLKAGKDAPTVVVGGKDYTAKHVILASGARARTIPQAGLAPEGKFIWTAREAMVPDTMPKKLLVIGSGAIGMEFASFYDAFVILAIGIVGNTEDMGLEKLGVKIDRTHITVDEYSFTGVKGLYAIGDVTTPPWLAHKASHEGIICIEKIAGGNPHPLDANAIPGCTYCYPQVASVGHTEAQAKAAGYDVKVGRFPFVGNGKAIALGEPEGLIKTVFDATLSEMMHEAVLDAYDRTIHF